MTRGYSLPFRTALAADVELGVWHYEREPGLPVRVGETIAGWDYLRKLTLRRSVVVWRSRLLAACGLLESDKIQIAVTVHSSPARYRAVRWQSTAIFGEKSVQEIEVELESASLAGEFTVDTEVLLAEISGSRRTFVAHLPGSRLFTDSLTVGLEGSASRMPIETAKFSEKLAWLGAPRAPWYVSCGSGDLQAPIMREMRIYLNADEPAFTDAARRAEPTLVTLLSADASRHILDCALGDPEFLAGSNDYAEGSLGEVAVRLLVLCFGNRKRSDVKDMADQDRAKFDATIQSVMNVTANV